MTWVGNANDPTESPGGDIIGYQLLMATPETGDDFEVIFDSVDIAT